MDGLIIVYIVFGFLGFVMLVSMTTMWVLWSRRKLTFCNFLNENGQWERESYKKNEITKTIQYDNETYNFDIEKCTHDKINRAIAHYYKGNPEQQIFDMKKTNKSVVINTKEITMKDFMVLMMSKVLRDIFQDDEVMQMLWIILIALGIGIVAIIIIQFAHKPDCVLQANNETFNIIAEGVRQGITKGK